MKFQVLQSTAGDAAEIVLATCPTYEDALDTVVKTAKSRDGFLTSYLVPDVWCIVSPNGNQTVTLIIQSVDS